jgi:hypothetical protein
MLSNECERSRISGRSSAEAHFIQFQNGRGHDCRERVVFFKRKSLNWIREYGTRRANAGAALLVVGTKGKPLDVVNRSDLVPSMPEDRENTEEGDGARVHTVATSPFGSTAVARTTSRISWDTTCNFYLGADKRAAKKGAWEGNHSWRGANWLLSRSC